MPTVATLAASSATSVAARRALNPSRFLAPAVIASGAYRSKDVILDGRTKTLRAFKLSSCNPTVQHESILASFPKLSTNSSSHGPNRQLHAFSSKEKSFSHLSAASSAFFRDTGGPVFGLPQLLRQRRSPQPSRACKNEVFGFKYPIITEKPEWWWRTLACVPYLIALQISDAGFYLQPFLDHYEFFGDLIYFVPGAITRLPAWFSMIYLYFAYVGIVKKKEWPHFFRFHLMMGMLLETALQVIWYTSNFFPLIHYTGTFGMHYWAGVGLAYIVILLQCVRCALAGGYANVPFISDAAYVHTLFNIGGFQRPF